MRLLDRSNISAITVTVIGGIFILVVSTLDSRGYLSNDSLSYLRLAASLIEGLGFRALITSDLQPYYFAVWPIGYSLLISASAFVFQVEPFWASKIVNVIAYFFCLVLIHRIFPVRGWVYAFYFLSGGVLNVFAHTWSEGVFLLSLLMFVFGMSRFMFFRRDGYLALILVSMLLLFLTRYIGLFAITIVFGTAVVCYVYKDWALAKRLIAICGIMTFFVIGYLYNNHRLTGHLTGMRRSPATESLGDLLYNLAIAELAEFNFVFAHIPSTLSRYAVLFWVIFVVPLLIWSFDRWRHHRDKTTDFSPIQDEPSRLSQLSFFYCLGTGIAYWIAIVWLRFASSFDGFSVRLLIPASMLLYFALLSYIQSRYSYWFISITRVILIMAVISVVYNVLYLPLQMARHNEVAFPAVLKSVRNEYEHIPAGSVVLCSSEFLLFLRPDLAVVANRHCADLSEAEVRARYHIDDGRTVFLSK